MHGKLPDGSVFDIPETRNVLTSLVGKHLWKSNTHLGIVASLAIQLLIFVLAPLSWSRTFFLGYFVLWRLLYNAGLGYILHKQSTDRWLVKFAQGNALFDPAVHPKFCRWVQAELQAGLKSPHDVKSAPVELNVWLCFRDVVDVILLNDFFSYCLFAWSWFDTTQSYASAWVALRWLAGCSLIVFNLFVKVDAHRVVTDLAWYWSDAFFLPMQDLVFDGIFELAPHPMYSVGYAGYYGLSLIVGSYTVFFISLAAHISQFMFLAFFENPHIERVYGQRKLIGREKASAEASVLEELSQTTTTATGSSTFKAPDISSLHDLHTYYLFKSPVFIFNLDLLRARDLFFVAALFYAVASSTLLLLDKAHLSKIFFCHALLWRLIHSAGLGILLYRQSQDRWFVRHFLKHYYFRGHTSAEVVREAFSNWVAIYNFSLTMTYLSFFLLALIHLKPLDPFQWSSDALRRTVGLALIGLHLWTARETYEVLGGFGWFYGDFFIEEYPRTLYYTGIYRFLNNPERIMGGAAFVGMSLFCDQKRVALLAIFSIACHILFLHLVENPHMNRLYGKALRKQSGISKAVDKFKDVEGVGNWLSSVSRAADHIEALLGRLMTALYRLFSVAGKAIRQKKRQLSRSRERLTLIRVADVSQIHVSDYTVGLLTPAPLHLGQPFEVEWTAPGDHSRADWIGIYPTGSDVNSTVTSVSSHKKWLGVYPEEWSGDVHIATSLFVDHERTISRKGIIKFATLDRLPSVPGRYELRYHHAGKHNIMCRSAPFDITIARPTSEQTKDSYAALLTIVRFCLRDDASLLPKACNVVDPFTNATYSDNNFLLASRKDAALIAFAIEQGFSVDLSPDVVMAAANVTDLLNTIEAARVVVSSVQAKQSSKEE